MLGVFAVFERAMIQERVKAGMARARAEGKAVGRPKIAAGVEQSIREALRVGRGIISTTKAISGVRTLDEPRSSARSMSTRSRAAHGLGVSAVQRVKAITWQTSRRVRVASNTGSGHRWLLRQPRLAQAAREVFAIGLQLERLF